MLSPGYMEFMVNSVGIILARSAMQPVHTVESNHLIMVALYMSKDEPARSTFLHLLENYGDFVCESWHRIYKAVYESNAAGHASAIGDINDMLKRISKS